MTDAERLGIRLAEGIARHRPQARAEAKTFLRLAHDLHASEAFYDKVKAQWHRADCLSEWRRWQSLHRACQWLLDDHKRIIDRLRIAGWRMLDAADFPKRTQEGQ